MPSNSRDYATGSQRPSFVDSLCLDTIIEIPHLDRKTRVDELGLPHFDVLKTPADAGFRRRAPAHYAQNRKVD